jgi:alcohol dehydrogenase/acrylyl-CoA reductase (NADPH)
MAPVAKRQRAWQTLGQHLNPVHLLALTRIEPMSALPKIAEDIVAGRIRGRVVVEIK